jgi:hypothetical protein
MMTINTATMTGDIDTTKGKMELMTQSVKWSSFYDVTCAIDGYIRDSGLRYDVTKACAYSLNDPWSYCFDVRPSLTLYS